MYIYLHMTAFQFTFNCINASTDPSPVKVEVCGLVQHLWEKICPLLIHSLTSNVEKLSQFVDVGGGVRYFYVNLQRESLINLISACE